MAVTQTGTDKYGTWYYIDSSSSKDVLTLSQQQTNATIFYGVCHDLFPTWTLNAISAILGNVQSEGVMNPNQWEYGYGKSTKHGYGLVQWTPATKFLDWCTSNAYPKNDIWHQVLRLEWERANGEQYYKTTKYPMPFTQYLTGSYTVDTLARAWLYNYERPGDPAASESTRVKNANYWYKYLSGQEPPDPGPDPDPGPGPTPKPLEHNRMPIWMYPGWR